MKKKKWYTQRNYVDVETGEIDNLRNKAIRMLVLKSKEEFELTLQKIADTFDVKLEVELKVKITDEN